mmetsp:Transcript_143298/g.249921  ORF Transcript_143298/g.249921 Transcript_143298/m.249921 type:complete len:488 (+) Transcript_143298:45-1508(+)
MRAGFDAPPTEIKASQLADYYGLRWFHVYLLLTISLTVAASAAMLGSTPYMLDAIIYEFGISDEVAPLAMSMVFVGSILGVFCGGRLSDVIGRRNAMAVSLLTLMTLALLHLVIPHRCGFTVLLAIRLIIGIPYGGLLAQQMPTIMEYFPDYARGTAATLSGIGWNAGNLYLLTFMPVSGHATRHWRFYFSFGPVVPCLVCLVMLYFVPESPRWLLTQGLAKDAQDSLTVILTSMPVMGTAPVGPAPRIDTTDLDKLGTSSLAQLSTTKSIELLFSKRLWWVTVALSLLYGFFAGPSNVIFNWGPRIVEEVMGVDPGADFFRIAEYFGMAGTLASVVLIDQVSRRGLLAASFVLAAICYMALVMRGFHFDSVVVAWALRNFFDCLLWSVVTVFMSEVFPTILRGTGSGAVMVLGRATSVFMPVLAGVWISESVNAVLVATAISSGVCALLTMTIPRDLTCQPMDDAVILDDAAHMPLKSSMNSDYNP